MNNAERFAGKSILVTGGGSGIGRAACLRLAAEGASVIAVDRHLEAAEMTAAAFPGRVVAVQGDITVMRDMERCVDEACSRFGKLDGSFNNAGIGPAELGAKGKRTAEFTEGEWSKIIEVNLNGTWMAMRAQIPALGRGASIVNNASIAGLVGIAGSAAYVASKHGVIGLTKSAALEYAGAGLRVNAVCPGYTLTAMTPSDEGVGGMIPEGRLGQPEEVVALVAWLLSDEASYVTGAAFNVDGGFLAQ